MHENDWYVRHGAADSAGACCSESTKRGATRPLAMLDKVGDGCTSTEMTIRLRALWALHVDRWAHGSNGLVSSTASWTSHQRRGLGYPTRDCEDRTATSIADSMRLLSNRAR